MTKCWPQNGLIIGKCFLIQIPVNQLNNYYFFGKKQVQIDPNKNLNNSHVQRVPYQKHLGLILGEKLNFKQMRLNFNFKQHIGSVISKVNKSISIVRKALI